MSLIVKVITRMILGPILIFAIYIFFHAKESHGVGFAGGLIASLALLLLLFVFGKDKVLKRISYFRLAIIRDIFVLLMLVMTVIGIYFGMDFADGRKYSAFASSLIILTNTSLCIASAGSLFLVFLNVLSFKKEN
ncbi:MnhB domain-containing protein [Elusimicrobiota bacterium]